jgi:hypothetical protein
MRWVKCRNPVEWQCDVCGRSGDEVDSIFHVGNIAVCCDCENHRERLLKELDIEGVDK